MEPDSYNGGMGGSSGGTQINWSDPNYWTGWNQTFGSLGGAIGQWVNAFDGNQQQQPMIVTQQPTETRNNTALYIGFGILALLLIIIIVVLFKKS